MLALFPGLTTSTLARTNLKKKLCSGKVWRRRKPVQYGTSQVKVTGGEAAPYDVFVGNTHPQSTMEIVKEVLIKVAESMPEEMKLNEPLEIIEVECLTKPRTDGRPIWNKNW